MNIQETCEAFYNRVCKLIPGKRFTEITEEMFDIDSNYCPRKIENIAKRLGMKFLGFGISRVVFSYKGMVLKFDWSIRNQHCNGIMTSGNRNELKAYKTGIKKNKNLRYFMAPIIKVVKLPKRNIVLVVPKLEVFDDNNENTEEHDEYFSNDKGIAKKSYMLCSFVFNDFHSENVGYLNNVAMMIDISGGAEHVRTQDFAQFFNKIKQSCKKALDEHKSNLTNTIRQLKLKVA